MHYMKMLHEEGACSPAMSWLKSSSTLSPRLQWDTCPDGSWMAWLLGLRRVREALPAEAISGLRAWAMNCATRALTIHAPSALLAAAACHPEEAHRDALLKHAEILAGQNLSATADAARYAADAAAADAARYARYARYAAADAARYARYAAAARYATADAAADAARYATDAARYATADAAAADAADAAERKAQADDLRQRIRWEWVEEALAKAGVELRTPAETVSPP